MVKRVCMVLLLVLASGVLGCQQVRYDPARATRPYPYHLHQANSIDIQVFRDKKWMEIVNSTPRSYHNVDLWINQRYVSPLDVLPAGKTVRLSLLEFYDERGEGVSAGGLLRTREPTPVRLVEMQLGEAEPLIGLITIRSEPAE